LCLQGITGAAVFKKWHGMGNGANLAYTKQSFEDVKGFESIDHIASGDDFFLIQKMKKLFPKDIYYLKSKEVIVTTKAEKNLSGFLNQRIRWASKANKYTDKSIFPVLLLVYLFNLSLAFLFTFSIINPVYFTFFNKSTVSILELSFSLLFVKTLIELFFLFKVAKFFENKLLLFWFSFFQPFHIVYTLISGLFGSFGKYEWKGRRVR
jgi:cellulose synthase/poly-beta-1,6-N-acetylglucosamine synthase-like glycosyltransferase